MRVLFFFFAVFLPRAPRCRFHLIPKVYLRQRCITRAISAFNFYREQAAVPIFAPSQPFRRVGFFFFSLKRAVEKAESRRRSALFPGIFFIFPSCSGSPRRSSRWRRGRSAVMNFQRSRAGNIKRCSQNLNTADSGSASPARAYARTHTRAQKHRYYFSHNPITSTNRERIAADTPAHG